MNLPFRRNSIIYDVDLKLLVLSFGKLEPWSFSQENLRSRLWFLVATHFCQKYCWFLVCFLPFKSHDPRDHNFTLNSFLEQCSHELNYLFSHTNVLFLNMTVECEFLQMWIPLLTMQVLINIFYSSFMFSLPWIQAAVFSYQFLYFYY